jgi:two-component system sensor histidine kinase KdpD
MNDKLAVRFAWLSRDLLALVVITATTVFLHWLRDVLSTSVIALLYLLPVLACTTRWGLEAGIVASVSGFLSFDYFFIPPYNTLAVHQTQDILVLFVFLVVAVVISQLVGRVKASLAEVQAKEHEILNLYELSVALSSARHEKEMAHVLVRHVSETFSAQAVEVIVQRESEETPGIVRAPSGSLPPDTQARHVSLMTSTRGQFGEIHLWREQALTPAEDRLLMTFAGEGALALERALLVQTETRAKILEESDRLKSALLSLVSHELRTPLVTIKAAATSLRSGEVDWHSPARAELLCVLEEEVDRMNQLIADLLSMSRLESGALKLQRQWNVLAEIVDTTIARMEPVTRQHRLDVSVPEDLPLIPVDLMLMQQVFTNLLSNCIKYAPPNTTVTIKARVQDASTLLVQVSNQGPFVPDQDLEHIFDKFYRITATDRIPGVGLGLSICKGIIEAHGGRIWAENLPDGFAFLFTLPLVSEGMSPFHGQPV